MATLRSTAFALAAGLMSVGAASAADLSAPGRPAAPVAPAPTWALQVTPYMWAAGMKGDISPFRRAPTIAIEKSFSDVLNDLNLGGFVNIWGRYDRYVLSVDAMYVDTTAAKAIGALPIVGATPGLSAKIDSKEFHATVQVGYRVVDTPQFTVDALAGGRVWHVSNDVAVNYGPFSVAYGENFSWFDPVIGARAFARLTDRLSFLAQADVGGFNAGSRFTWQALATLNYAFTDNLSASAGYKVLKVDYRSGGHVFDVTLSGPVLGMTYRF